MLPKEKIKREWHLIDASGKILGRLATKITTLLVGKHKPTYTPHLDCGDWVVVINAEKIRVSGKKQEQKRYRWHTGYPGGLKELTFKQMMARDPRRVIWLAVKNMLPKNKLRKKRLARLKIFVGDKHPYENQIKKNE